VGGPEGQSSVDLIWKKINWEVKFFTARQLVAGLRALHFAGPRAAQPLALLGSAGYAELGITGQSLPERMVCSIQTDPAMIALANSK